MITFWEYYIVATTVFIIACYVINKMNKHKKYLIRIEGGEIFDSCNSKALANSLLYKIKKIQRRSDIVVEKVK